MASVVNSHQPARPTHVEVDGWVGSNKTKCFWTCIAACSVNGMMYSFPLFTPGLIKNGGFSASQIVIAGVLMQFGYGGLSYGFGKIYTSTFYSPSQMDTIMNVMVSSMLVLSTFLLGIFLQFNVKAVPLMTFFFFAYGVALGSTYFHSVYLANFMYQNKGARRRSISAMSFAMGTGSLVYTLMFHYATSSLSLAVNFFIMSTIYLIVGVFRVTYMYRARFESLEEDNVVQTALEPAETEMVELALNDGVPNAEEEVVVALPPALTEAHVFRWTAYLCDAVVVLTCISTFFSFGVSSSFLSSMGNLASDLSASESTQITFYMTFAFLGAVIASRIITTVVYAYYNYPYVMVLWQGCLCVGIGIYTFQQSLVSAYLSSALVGAAFGGISSCPAVIASQNFPGTDYSFNLALSITVMAFGPPVIGFSQTVVYNAPSIAHFDQNFSTFLYFLVASLFSTVCALVLGILIKKQQKNV